MDDVVVVHDTDLDELPLGHQFGKMAVGSAAAFVANRVAEVAYVKVLNALRARRK